MAYKKIEKGAVKSEQLRAFCEESDFEVLLEDAQFNVSGEGKDWAKGFIEDMVEKFEKYGDTMYISEKQFTKVKQIAGHKD